MPKRYAVTGGGGFVGKALCRALIARGDTVVSLSRGEYPDLSEIGVVCARVDISRDPSTWLDVIKGCDGVFHTAAKVDMWGARPDFYMTNVIGTRNVIQACRDSGISCLVVTSSPSVVHTGSDLCGVDERQPIADHFDAFYPETKAIAEREALQAADGGLGVVALRPHLIWGPNDTNLIPAIVERAKSGQLARIGSGANRVDLTFIEDCVEAHLLAMKALEERPKEVSGKTYFISQGDPVELWPWIDEVLLAHGLPRVRKHIPYAIASVIATALEAIARLLLLFGVSKQPRLTKFLVSEMATSHYFDISAARRDLGYAPSMSVAQAMQKTFGVAA